MKTFFNKVLKDHSRAHSLSEEQLSAAFDALAPVSGDEILSRWRGAGFDTGHWLYAALAELQWFGKWIVSPSDVRPLICRTEAGALVSSQAMHGDASLWMAEFRNQVSATVVYDGVPMFGHLRRIDNDSLLGVVSGKTIGGMELVPAGKHQYFLLERIAEWPEPFVA